MDRAADRDGAAARLVRAAAADPGAGQYTRQLVHLTGDRTRYWQRLEKLLLRHEALLLPDGGERPSISPAVVAAG